MKSSKTKTLIIFAVLFIGFQFILIGNDNLTSFKKDENGHIVRPAKSKTYYLSLNDFEDNSPESQEIYDSIVDSVNNELVPDLLRVAEEITSVAYNQSRQVEIIKDITGIDVRDYMNLND